MTAVGPAEGASSDGDEDNVLSSGDSDGTKYSEYTLKEQRPCCCCCTAQRVYHVMYVVLFLAYVIVFPLWAKWLITAPMPYVFWNDDLLPFPLLPLKYTNISRKAQPGIFMSEIPRDQLSCNYSCGEDFLGFRSNLMNFEVAMSLNKGNLEKSFVHTTYPVLLASEDFDHWQLVADRRHADPEPFFRSRTATGGEVYIHTTEQCMKEPGAANASLTSEWVYILGCNTWQVASQDALSKLKTVTNADLNRHCNSLGGVCGWPCGSNIPSDRLPGCSAEGVIDVPTLSQHMPNASTGGKVHIYACDAPAEKSEDCMLSTKQMSQWKCHFCQSEQESDDADSAGDGDSGGGDGDADGEDGGDADGGFDYFGRRLRHRRRLDGEPDDEKINKRYVSLPQMRVQVHNPMVPPDADIFNTPRSWVFAARSLEGPWERLYSGEEIKSVPVGAELPEQKITREGDFRNAMKLDHMNELTLSSESCFGKRGPLYLVACAVNSSIYEEQGLWRGRNNTFSLGQEVAGPPFNDRCIAVAGRCGHACVSEDHGPMPFCTADGQIDQEALVGDIKIQYNRVPTVMIFISVLLCGFAVKSLMLCPGIFTPYKHAHDYDPEMTESFRYIVVVSPVAGADENKGTMLRNIIGTVSCMPPECRCRYHVVVNDEGHRNEMKVCWQLFCNIVAAVPNFGGDSYERNLLEFTHVWCIETKMLTLPQVGGKVKQLDEKVLDKLCGKTALKKLLKESKWRTWDKVHLTHLEAAMEALAQDLQTNYNKFTQSTHNQDNVGDWAPKDPLSLPLRMHYTSRAKPVEDSRNIMVQHVGIGSWYYKVPKGSTTEDWLQLRGHPKEMIYALPDNDEDSYQVPLRSSHGKAGGLNFVDNYMTLVARRPENAYNDDRDEAPTLYAIADARHQFQPDFMLSCVPCFFKENGDLNVRVAFTQAPQHYPEYADSNDYMDYNNAQFFRLNAMIRNCCGGCSSCGTNGMWLLPSREDDGIWEKRRKRVRDKDSKRREGLIEREQFHTSCKIEDTASSLDQVLIGRHSHFVNRKLSFGMAKAPTDFIGAQQRWVEGAVTLALQWFSGTADSHGAAAKNGWMLWATVVMFAVFVGSLLRLVVSVSNTSIFVEYDLVDKKTFQGYFDPFRDFIWQYLFCFGMTTCQGGFDVLELLGANEINLDVFKHLFKQFLIWTTTCCFCFFLIWLVTMFAKVLSRCCCGASFPNEMRWWGRLLISMDNLTYFIWFWTSFFWVGFNYYTALFKMHFHFNNMGMMAFMLVVNLLNWGLIICNSCRYSVMESVDANEVAALSMDNVWRANQLFFMTGPIQLFSIVRGISEFIKYKFYGQDIGGWSGGDLGKISVNIVKYWTTFLLMCCVGVWICYVVYAHEYNNSFAACVVITMISLDVLHPCVFLWLGNVVLPDQELDRMTCLECLTTVRWWQVKVKDLILNNTLTSFLKFLAPAYFLLLPIMSLASSYFGLTGAYMLVAMGPGH